MNECNYNVYKNIVNKGIKIKEILINHKNVKLSSFVKLYLFLFFIYISKEEENNEIQTNYSYIELIVKGQGNKNIFYIDENNINCKGMIPPDEMQINIMKNLFIIRIWYNI